MHHALGRQLSTKTLPLRALGTVPARCTIDVTLTTTERLARLETAQEIISMMIALRSEWLHAEAAKAVRDDAQVSEWEAERSRLSGEQLLLGMDDDVSIDRVLNEYGPVVKAAYAA